MKRSRLFVWGVLILSIVALSRSPMVVRSQDPGEHDHDPVLDAETLALIDDVRAATAKYRDVTEAEADGYAIFQDCFKNDEIGGMGQHYVQGDFLGDTELDPMHPEALVYEPLEDGSLILVAMEYIVIADNWKEADPPSLYGLEFHLNPNVPDTPPLWVLHIWLYTHNPEGMFADYNPTVSCPEKVE